MPSPRRIMFRLGVLSSGLLLPLISGCQESPNSAVPPNGRTGSVPANPISATATEDSGHAHKAGSHGGIVVSIGLDSYHTEAIVEKGGQLRLIMLGKDESRIQEVEMQTLTAYVKSSGEAESVSMELAAVPQTGDAVGKTSQFIGQLPAGLESRPIEVTIPMLRIEGERFRVGFSTEVESHPVDMPPSLPITEERTLYLTAGGRYTLADILANGNVTASEKFRGIKATHNMKPNAGDKVCPITNTKANPEFTWIVGGQPYQFCCPPCVDEFVALAKEHPDEIKPPESYVR